MIQNLRKVAHRYAKKKANSSRTFHQKARWHRRAWYLDDGPSGARQTTLRKQRLDS